MTAPEPFGSYRYLSPELCNPPDDEVPERTLESDVWAWGCLLLEVGLIVLPRLLRR
jgi:hypothetical protein